MWYVSRNLVAFCKIVSTPISLYRSLLALTATPLALRLSLPVPSYLPEQQLLHPQIRLLPFLLQSRTYTNNDIRISC